MILKRVLPCCPVVITCIFKIDTFSMLNFDILQLELGVKTLRYYSRAKERLQKEKQNKHYAAQQSVILQDLNKRLRVRKCQTLNIYSKLENF